MSLEQSKNSFGHTNDGIEIIDITPKATQDGSTSKRNLVDMVREHKRASSLILAAALATAALKQSVTAKQHVNDAFYHSQFVSSAATIRDGENTFETALSNTRKVITELRTTTVGSYHTQSSVGSNRVTYWQETLTVPAGFTTRNRLPAFYQLSYVDNQVKGPAAVAEVYGAAGFFNVSLLVGQPGATAETLYDSRPKQAFNIHGIFSYDTASTSPCGGAAALACPPAQPVIELQNEITTSVGNPVDAVVAVNGANYQAFASRPTTQTDVDLFKTEYSTALNETVDLINPGIGKLYDLQEIN